MTIITKRNTTIRLRHCLWPLEKYSNMQYGEIRDCRHCLRNNQTRTCGTRTLTLKNDNVMQWSQCFIGCPWYIDASLKTYMLGWPMT